MSVHSCLLASPDEDNEPFCFVEVKGVKEWDYVMDEEMNVLTKNETWDLVPKPKDGPYHT